MPTKLRNIIGPIFHVIASVHHLNALLYSNKSRWTDDLNKVTDQRVLDMEKFAPIYFTSWNMIIQTIYFLLATFYDVLYIFSKKESLQANILLYKGYIFTSLLFPCSLFVSAMFWSVYTINREWVLPEVLDEYVPSWLNHSLHTNIVVVLIIEVLIVNQLMPTFKSAFIGLTLLSGTYHILFVLAYFFHGRWAYGLFHIFSWPERIIFMLCNYLFTVFVMKVGIKIQNFKHSLVRRSSIKVIKNE